MVGIVCYLMDSVGAYGNTPPPSRSDVRVTRHRGFTSPVGGARGRGKHCPYVVVSGNPT
jgi:hypothetical protein